MVRRRDDRAPRSGLLPHEAEALEAYRDGVRVPVIAFVLEMTEAEVHALAAREGVGPDRPARRRTLGTVLDAEAIDALSIGRGWIGLGEVLSMETQASLLRTADGGLQGDAVFTVVGVDRRSHEATARLRVPPQVARLFVETLLSAPFDDGPLAEGASVHAARPWTTLQLATTAGLHLELASRSQRPFDDPWTLLLRETELHTRSRLVGAAIAEIGPYLGPEILARLCDVASEGRSRLR